MITKLMKWLDGKDRAYFSETDRFMRDFDKKNPTLSASQKAEIEKHRNIFERKTDDRIRW